MPARSVVALLLLLSSAVLATDPFVDINGAALRPGMTQEAVELALRKAGSVVTRMAEGPNGIWSVRAEGKAAIRSHTLDFRDGKLRTVARNIAIVQGDAAAPDITAMVNTLFHALHDLEAAGSSRVVFSTSERTEETARSRTVAFFVGGKIYSFDVFEPIGEGSLVVTQVDMEESMEAKEPKKP
ncbi:MAG: hypothetical protein ABSE35_17030 [Bryobacteraceae bacterium]|jgi:hypothetical protein